MHVFIKFGSSSCPFMQEVIFMVLRPINQVMTPCFSAPNPKRFESTNDPPKER
jgi:hypothetical protein